jgi:hypothetical protein
MADISMADIKVGLLARIDTVVRELLPSGHLDGDEWCAGSVEGEAGQSLRVNVGKNRAGVWSDFATGEVGDVVDLVAACLFRGDKKRAFRWALSWLGLDDKDPYRLAQKREAHARANVVRKEDADAQEARYRRAAQRIFYGADDLPGTPAWTYLTQTRAIDLASLGRLPRALRAVRSLYHKGHDEHVPALIAAITDSKGAFLGVHRHYLRCLSDGRVVKAWPDRSAKMSLGRYKADGGYIRVWRGASRKPFNTPEPGEWVAVTEGLEDALSVAVSMPHLRVACAVSVSNLHNIKWPAGIGGIYVCTDNDGENSATTEAYNKAYAAYKAQGLAVRVVQPPKEYKDFNDLIRGVVHA